MFSKYILGILCVTLLVKYHDAIQPTSKCPFLSTRPQQQHEDEQNFGDDHCKNVPSVKKNCNFSDIYYSINGSCNHVSNPNWGTAGTAFVRLLPAYYSDGLLELRKSVDGSPLPLPRKLSVSLLPDQNVKDNRLNIWFYGFGQFVDHDVTLSKEIRTEKEICCVNNKPAPKQSEHCLPIIIPEDDAFYQQFGVTCLELKRVSHTLLFKNFNNCSSVKPVFQINSQTTFLDLSILYGTNEAQANSLRSGVGGKLKIQNDEKTGNQEFPPIIPAKQCNYEIGGVKREARGDCFMSGDDRTSQNPEILLVDVVFHRLHNRIAKSLQSINPKWDDERLFKEARRIAIAMYQHVIYSEYLPVLLGSKIVNLYKLLPVSSGYATGHDPNLNPQTLVSYAAAAARSGHSNIVGSMKFNGPNRRMSIKLREVFSKHDWLLSKDMFTRIIQEFTQRRSSRPDQFTTEEISNFTLISPNLPYGLDLTATDIIRGRDFGLPPYNKFREVCGLCKLNNFTDLANDIRRPEDVQTLASLYKSVDDIDYFVGGQLEKPLSGGTLGQSFACIIAESFFRWKFGDRLFYEFAIAKFTLPQLNSIRTTTMSSILCATNPSLKNTRKNSFLAQSIKNQRVPCSQLPMIDLQPWKE